MDCDYSQAPNHPDLKVVRLGAQKCKQRKTFCFTGLSHEVNYKVYNNSITAIEKAVKERIYYIKDDNGLFTQVIPPSKLAFISTIGDFEKQMKKLSTFATPMEAVAHAMSYQDRRRPIYLKAAEDNKLYGFHDYLANTKLFMKCEKYNFTDKIPVPRAIQPGDPRYLSETGRYIKPIEKKIYESINKLFGYVVVYKGLNADNRALHIKEAWDDFTNPVAIGLDAARFDQRVSIPALQLDHQVICNYYPGDKHIKRLMKLQLHRKGTARCADGWLSYKTVGGRKSGDSNTSCGNVTICCAIMYGFSQSINYKIKLINDGDDCVVIMEEKNSRNFLKEIPRHFNTAGFKIVVEDPVYDLEKIVFCQSQPVRKNDGAYTMVRDPRVSISKDCVSLKPLDNERVKKMWLAAVGKGGLSLTTGMPVLQSFYNVFVRASEGSKALSDPTLEGGFFRLSKGMQLTDTTIVAETRFSFWLAFGITPGEQECLEEYYDQYQMNAGDERHRFTNLPLRGA